MSISQFQKKKTLRITIDQLGRTLKFSQAPTRIISLVPSITELLCDLGLTNNLVGCTLYCVHPASIQHICRVGGTKKIDLDKVASLRPDVVIANKEENTQSDIESLMSLYNVWISDVHNHLDAQQMIQRISALFDRTKAGDSIVSQTNKCLSMVSSNHSIRTLYLIWRKPYMSVGNDTYIHDIMQRCGFDNVCDVHTRYPKLTAQDIRSLAPQLILLSSEPFPFKEKHLEELRDISPNSKVCLVNGEFFSWYGSRVANMLEGPILKDIYGFSEL